MKNKLIDRLIDTKTEYKNPEWRKRWVNFVKYDNDYHGYFLLRLIVYKLELMRDTFLKDNHTEEKTISSIIFELDETIALGYSILEEDSFEESNKFRAEHFHVESSITNFHGEEVKCYEGVWDSEENSQKYRRLIEENSQKHKEIEKKFFMSICDNYLKWWN